MSAKKIQKHPTKREEKRLMDFTDQMEYLFSVNNYDRSFAYKSSDESEGTGNVAASVSVNVPYQRIHIDIYPVFFTLSLREQREVLLHEFCHCIIEPVQKIAEDLFSGKFRTEKDKEAAVEQSTSRVAQLLDAQLRGKHVYARKAYAKYLK